MNVTYMKVNSHETTRSNLNYLNLVHKLEPESEPTVLVHICFLIFDTFAVVIMAYHYV